MSSVSLDSSPRRQCVAAVAIDDHTWVAIRGQICAKSLSETSPSYMREGEREGERDVELLNVRH